MEKLRKIVDKIYDGKLPKGFTPYLADRLSYIYSELAHYRTAEFIASEIYDLLIKCKIKVEPRGIGWVAHR